MQDHTNRTLIIVMIIILLVILIVYFVPHGTYFYQTNNPVIHTVRVNSPVIQTHTTYTSTAPTTTYQQTTTTTENTTTSNHAY